MRLLWTLVIPLFLVLLISGCVNEDDVWINPNIECTFSTSETPIKQYPYQHNLSTDEMKDSEGFLDFCTRMENTFSDSGIKIKEANIIYGLIHEADYVKDGSYGMPSPGVPPRPRLSIWDIKKRVAIRKVNDNQYEIFYSEISCGTNYEFIMLEIQNNEIINQQRIEAWSASYPC